MKKLKFILVSLLSMCAFLGITACDKGKASYTVEHNFSLNETSVELEVGQTFDIIATYGGEKVTYSVDDTEIASVSDTGKVTACKVGVAYVTVSAGEQTRVCKITIVDVEYTVEFDSQELILMVNTRKKLQVSLLRDGAPYNGKATWTASGGTLSSDGTSAWFYASEKGEYVVTVESDTGATASCEITVIEELDDISSSNSEE